MKGRYHRHFPGKQPAAVKRLGTVMGSGAGTAPAPRRRRHAGNYHHLRLRKESGGVAQGWDLAGQGCLLALVEAFWVTLGRWVPVAPPGRGFGAWGDTGSSADLLYMRGPLSWGFSPVIHKHGHGLRVAEGSPAPLWEDGKGKAAEAASTEPLAPDLLLASSGVALLTPLVQSGLHKSNHRDQA